MPACMQCNGVVLTSNTNSTCHFSCTLCITIRSDQILGRRVWTKSDQMRSRETRLVQRSSAWSAGSVRCRASGGQYLASESIL
jgi:hypothetical protein